MNRELEFLEKLRELKVFVSGGQTKVSDDEIKAFFSGQDLNAQQLQMIRDYIEEDDKNEDDLSEDDLEYLKECEECYGGIPELDTSDLSAYQRVIEGNKRSYEMLAAQYMQKVLDIAKAHKTADVFLGDLVSEGLVGLTEGLKTIRCAQTAHEEIMGSIRKSIRLYLMEREAVMSRDNTIIDKVRKMDEALNILKEDLGRKVYIEEIADYMQITEEEVWDILKLTGEDVGADEEEEA